MMQALGNRRLDESVAVTMGQPTKRGVPVEDENDRNARHVDQRGTWPRKREWCDDGEKALCSGDDEQCAEKRAKGVEPSSRAWESMPTRFRAVHAYSSLCLFVSDIERYVNRPVPACGRL